MTDWRDVALTAIIGVAIGTILGGGLVASETVWMDDQVQTLVNGFPYLAGHAVGYCEARVEMNATSWEACSREHICPVMQPEHRVAACQPDQDGRRDA